LVFPSQISLRNLQLSIVIRNAITNDYNATRDVRRLALHIALDEGEILRCNGIILHESVMSVPRNLISLRDGVVGKIIAEGGESPTHSPHTNTESIEAPFDRMHLTSFANNAGRTRTRARARALSHTTHECGRARACTHARTHTDRETQHDVHVVRSIVRFVVAFFVEQKR